MWIKTTSERIIDLAGCHIDIAKHDQEHILEAWFSRHAVTEIAHGTLKEMRLLREKIWKALATPKIDVLSFLEAKSSTQVQRELW